jgi:tetratricopeptide (TPR) repeat protein
MGPDNTGAPIANRAGVKIHLTVLDESKKPLKQQALIRLTNQDNGRVFFQTTNRSDTDFPDIPPGKYMAEVGAAGYVGWHAQITIADIAHDFSETVLLARDPAAVDLRLNDAGQIPPKARKEAERGRQALELSNFSEARKYLESANHSYPSSSSINFLLGYLALQQKDEEHELTYLTVATKLDPKNLQAQNLLGQLYYRRGDYAHAVEAEEMVIGRSEQSLIARKVLANSYLKLSQFEKARENSQWMVDHGGSEGASARLVLGQALAGMGKREQAIQVLTAYLDGEHTSPVAAKIKELISRLQAQTDAKAGAGIGDPELTAEDDSAAGNAGMPSDVDAQQPSTAAGVQCPVNLLDETANRSKDLAGSISQFSAIEHIVHENISAQGIPRSRQTRQFNYIAAINESAQGMLLIQEYRDAGDLEMPDKITTTGLPALAIAFHPLYRNDFEMRCEGLGEWQGQAAWLVHFRQAEGKPSRLRSYVVNKVGYPVNLKGRAWILADNFQIVHMETDLVQGIPDVRLTTEHTSVNYGPVQFRKNTTELWLPKSAELYVHLGKTRFHRSESFDHFMLFATDATEKAKLPVDKTGPAGGEHLDNGSPAGAEHLTAAPPQ